MTTDARTAASLLYLVDDQTVALTVDDPDPCDPLRGLFQAHVDPTHPT